MVADGPWPALVALAAALLVWSPRHAVAGGRRRALLDSLAGALPQERGALLPVAREPGGGVLTVRRRWALAALAGGAVALSLGGPIGGAAGLGAAVGLERLLRSVASDEGRRAAELVRELPVACDLLGVCLTAGVPVSRALAAVADSVRGPLRAQLGLVAGLYQLGAEPRAAWADAPPELAPLGRVLVRAGESGTTVAASLRVLAADSRAAARAATDARVRRAGVWVLAPLGVCFLPAFVCLGVVPLVLGIAGDVFGR